MPRIPQIESQFRQTITEAKALATLMEQGQAQMPLADHFGNLAQSLERRPFSVTLLCLDTASRESVLKWLYGQQFAVFSLQMSGQIGLLEVQLKDKGYAFENSAGRRQEFDSWEELVHAVGEVKVIGSEAAEGLKLITQRVNEVKNLSLLLPDSIAAIQQSPALLTRILRETNVLIVAAHPHYQLSETERTVINDLMAEMEGFWPLLPVDELAEEISIPERGWWQQVRHPLINMPPKLITTHVNAGLPALLTGPDNELRQALQLLGLAKKASTAVDAVNERLAQELRQLDSRKKREARKATSGLGGYSTEAGLSGQLRNQLSDGIGDIGKRLQEKSRRNETATGDTGQQLSQLIGSLQPGDLAMEAGYKSIKLSLSQKYQQELTQFLRNALKTGVRRDAETVQESLATLRQSLQAEFRNHTGSTPQLEIDTLDKERLIDDLTSAVSLEMRYQGEMPKRGFFQRLGEARRAAFVILMSVSLLAMMGVNLRDNPLLGVVIFFVFVGAFIYTYFGWKREDKERLEKEVTRVREEVQNNSRRLLAELNREKQSRIADFLERVKKQWQQLLDKSLQEWQQRERQQSERESQQARQRIASIDAQISQWQRQQMPAQKLQTSVGRIVADCRTELEALADA